MNLPDKAPPLNLGKRPSPEMLRSLIEAGLGEEVRAIEQRYPEVLIPKDGEVIANTETESWLLKFVTQHPRLQETKEHVRILASLQHPVLITGDTGTGKELLARALHGMRKGAFIDINCAAVTETLFESELFGHVKGAYTGALTDTLGLIGAAANGTLFLDEVGDMPYSLQAKLLRVIQEGQYRQVGGTTNLKCSCRFVAATHWKLDKCLASSDRPEGAPKFRDDLYARLSMFELKTLPLRDRLSDIPLILDALDPDKKFPRNVDWSERPLPFNVRSLQRLVLQHKVLGKTPFGILG